MIVLCSGCGRGTEACWCTGDEPACVDCGAEARTFAGGVWLCDPCDHKRDADAAAQVAALQRNKS